MTNRLLVLFAAAPLARLGLIAIVLSGTYCRRTDNNPLNSEEASGGEHYVDAKGRFAITIPRHCAKKLKTGDNYSELLFTCERPYKIGVLLTSRRLSPDEASLEPNSLLDRMLNSSVEHLEHQGAKIVNVGKAKELKENCRTFVITAALESDGRLVTHWGTVVKDRAYGLIIRTVDAQASPELAALVEDLVDSIEIP